MNSTLTDAGKENAQYIFELLKTGEENIKLAGYKNVVLILGNTGSGKSTFSQFITGNNDDLTSVETSENSGDFIVLDKANKISNSTIISKTLFPDLFVSENTGTIFYDCPGFSDTRNVAHDISSTYFTKKVIDSSKAVKLVFVVNYSSVRKGVDRKDFILLLKHITTLLKDVKKFKNSIALVVTKIDNQYIKKNGSAVLVPDEKVIDTIADFLKFAKQDIIAQSSFPSLQINNNKEFTAKALFLIDSFLETNEGRYTKIGIFRRPDEPGPLSLIELLQNGKKSLENIIYNNIDYAEKTYNDFGYTISPESKNYVQDLADEINKSLSKEINDIGSQIKEYTVRDEYTSNDIFLLYDRFKSGIEIFSKYDLESFEHSKRFIKQILKDIRQLNTKVASDSLQNIINLNDYLTFLEVVGGKILKNPLKWAKGFSGVMQYYRNSKKWYEFLIDLDEWLSEYKTQKYRFNFKITKLLRQCHVEQGVETKADEIDFKSLLNQIKSYKTGLNIDKILNDINGLTLDYGKLNNLKLVLDINLNHKTNFECSESNKLVVKGQFVALRDIPLTMCPEELQYLEIFASNKIFFDKDIDQPGTELQLTIIAPTWEIIGNKIINLNGKAGETLGKALNGFGFSTRGEDGRPGGAGGPGGNFLGITHKVVGGNLNVSVNGGEGGKGQEGGDGSAGKMGKDPPYVRDSVTRTIFNQWGPEYDWEDDGFTWEYTGTWERLIVAWYYYRAKGKLASKGGNGGNGGMGGPGGNPGSFSIIDFSNSGKLFGTANHGIQGPGGEGGKGGRGAPNGRIANAQCRIDRYILIAVTNCNNAGSSYNGESERGINGYFGVNTDNLETPKNGRPFVKPLFTINHYKYFLRESLAHSIKSSSLIDFINKIESRNDIAKFYDTLGLVNELEGLENQYSSLSENIGITSFYQSLLDRIDNYAMNPKDSERTSEYKKILAHLYTATLSKISSLNSKRNDVLIVGISTFLDIVVQNIKKFNLIQSKAAINNVMLDYRKGIESQIKSAQYNIKLNIIPEIDSIFNNIDNQIEVLVNDTITIIKDTNQEKLELRKKQEDLERSILLKCLLGPIKMVSEYLNLGGPLVEEMTKSLKEGFGNVAEHFSLNENLNMPNLFTFLTSLSGIIGPSFGKINDISLDNHRLFNAQLDDIATNLKNYIEVNTNNSIHDIHSKLIETKIQLENEITKDKLIDPSVINVLKQELAKELETKKNVLEKMKEVSGTGEDDLRIINHSQKILDINDISSTYYLSIKNDQDRINFIGDNIKSLNKKIRILQNFEFNIYRIIVPSLRQLKKIVDMAKSNVGDKTFAKLEISKLGLQNVINEIKFEIRQLTKEINLGEELIRCLEKIDETLSIIFNIYARLDDYYEKAKLAAYIAEINSPKALGIRLSDPHLESALNTLQLSIRSNLLLEQYNKAMEAFTQLVFPFANIYLDEFNLPKSFNLGKSLDSLIFIASQKLEQLKTRLLESTISINKYDVYKHSNIKFNSENRYSTPFFVWKNELNRVTIARLLDGFEVNLKADIINGVNHDAVKFNVIGINFKAASNDTLQQELNNDIEHYEVMMQHHGYSYYGCGDEFYVITNEKLTFSYHMEKDVNGDPVNKNTVFDKIKNSEALLSPYTMWTIKLVHPFEDFKELSKYKKENIDLELIGVGEYIERGKIDIKVCNKELEKYYQVDESISEFNSIYRYLEEESDNVTTEINLIPVRRKRQLEDTTYKIGHNMVGKSAGNSISKSSPINNIMNAIITGLSFLTCLRPFDRVKQWIGQQENNYFDKTNEFAPSYQIEHQQYFWKKGVSSEGILDENLHINQFIDNSILKSSSNLLLWNLLLKKLNKVELKQNKPYRFKNEIEDDYSHLLAYNFYANTHLGPTKKFVDFNIQCNNQKNKGFPQYEANNVEYLSYQNIHSVKEEVHPSVPLLE